MEEGRSDINNVIVLTATVVGALMVPQKMPKKNYASFPEGFTDQPAKNIQDALGRPEVGIIRI